ncbi:TonB-dependent receptor [Marinoscillum sp. 108]|uniref:TonB-dependent receptor n=1 Tax=Marinoscillum sp. 108 TaxID=2653151 RepID=UPI0013585FB0|nr:TonB-dependent receptor [Marinoscillum sp. 108]
MRHFLLIAGLMLIGQLAVTGQDFNLSGTVVDERGEEIIGAGVLLEELGLGTSTDLNGKFKLFAPKRNYTLIVQYLGYKEYRNTIYLNRHIDLTVRMESTFTQLQEVVKTARAEDYRIKSIPGVERLTIKDVEDVPLLMGELDIVNSILLLPGVSNAGEGSTGFNVRGGKVDQNLITLDGSEVFNSSHLLGFFSIFNSDVIKDFTLYKGHMPATFGGRLSSVLDVNTREGSYEQMEGSVTVGPVTSKLSFETPIIQNKLSVLAAARFAYPNWVIGQMKDYDVKRSKAVFDDQNLILGYRINDRNKVNLSFYRSFDRFRFSDDFEFNWGHVMGSLTMQNVISDVFLHELKINHVDYHNRQYDVAEDYEIQNGIASTSLKDNFLYEGFTNHQINMGLEIKDYHQKPEERLAGGRSGVVPAHVEKDRGVLGSIYVDDEWALGKLTLSGGLRYNYYVMLARNEFLLYELGQPKSLTNIVDTAHVSAGDVNYANLEPRVGLNFLMTPNISLKASYNRVYQYLHLISNTTSATPIDLWQVSTFHIEPQQSSNYSLGMSFTNDRRRWQNSVDVFYRDISNIYDYRDFADLLLNNHLETELLQGQGRSYGLEFLFEKQKGKWTGWLAYTLSKSENLVNGPSETERINDGKWYPSNYDQRHNLSVVAKRDLGGDKAFFSVNMVYNSGRPFTGVESSYYFNNAVVPLYSSRNKYRIPDYVRFDVGLGFNSVFKKWEDQLNFSVYNLFGRANAYSIYYRKPTSTAIIPFSYKLTVLGQAFPSITYTVSFK